MHDRVENLDEYLVAYIDILGGKNLILNDKGNKNLNTVKEIYKFAMDSLTESSVKNATQNLKIKIFSDNIVVASKIKTVTLRQITLSIVNFFRFIAYFQRKALDKGILLRGGVSIGELYIQDDFVWGKALISAYEVEQQANDPIIMIENNAFERIEMLRKTFPPELEKEFFIIEDGRDKDYGWFWWEPYVDYLALFLSTENMKYYVQKWKQNIEKNICEHRYNKNVLEKMLYQVKYHNYFCERYQLENLLSYAIDPASIHIFLRSIYDLERRLGVDSLTPNQIKPYAETQS